MPTIAEHLVESLADLDVDGRPVLIARAAEARAVLPDALRQRGAEVDEVALYETVREEPSAEPQTRAITAFDIYSDSDAVTEFDPYFVGD